MEALNLKVHDGTGLLTTFCGLDGCGKSTMIEKTAAYLEKKGHSLLLTRQPTDFVRRSDIFRTYMDLEDHDNYEYRSLSLLAASDRVQHSCHVILPALREGKTVISDRYFYSCLANLRARGYREDRWIYEIAETIPKPDLAFFLDVPVKTAVARVRSRAAEKDRYIDMALQYELRKEYREICGRSGGILINAEGPWEQTFAAVREKIDELLARRPDMSGQVLALLGELAAGSSVCRESRLSEDLGLDSFGRVSLILALEELLDAEFEESDLDPFQLVTAGDVVRLAQKYAGGAYENTAAV